MIRPWVANLIILMAASAWTMNFVLSIVRDGYVINESVNSVFLAVITGVIASKLHDKEKEDDEGKDTDDKDEKDDADPVDPGPRSGGAA
jgi:hypothetical protein